MKKQFILGVLLMLGAFLSVIGGCSNKHNQTDESVVLTDISECRESETVEKAVIHTYNQLQLDYSDLRILDANQIYHTDDIVLFTRNKERAYTYAVPKEQVQTSYEEVFKNQNDNLRDLYVSVHVNYVKTVSFTKHAVIYSITEYSDGTVETKQAPVDRFETLGYSVIDVTINDLIYTKGSFFEGREEEFKKIIGTTVDVFSATFWKPDELKGLVRYSGYLDVETESVPTAYVPAPDTDIIINLRYGFPWIYDNAESFIEKANNAHDYILGLLLCNNPTAGNAYLVGFDEYDGVTNVFMNPLLLFWPAKDLEGNQITDATSFQEYLLSLDRKFRTKAAENPDYLFPQGYVGIYDSRNEILMPICLGFK